jgi:diketogulonate reductase-like aldo/keto reductase
MCLDFGVNMFDSADIYSAGLAEEILGAAIKGKRDRAISQRRPLSARETAPMTWALLAII